MTLTKDKIVHYYEFDSIFGTITEIAFSIFVLLFTIIYIDEPYPSHDFSTLLKLLLISPNLEQSG